MKLSILAKILDLVFPRYCPICGDRLLGEEWGVCLPCHRHLPETWTWEDPYSNPMARQFWHLIPIERCAALFLYDGGSPASLLIYRLKYGGDYRIGYWLGRQLAREGLRTGFFDGIDGIVPIPLARNRMRQRGYNQSECIARGIAELTRLPVITDMVYRVCFKESQTKKDRWQRNANVEGIFQPTDKYLKDPRRRDSVEGHHFLVVDDVCTTGATIISCCKAIQQIGKAKFSVLAVGWAKE